MPCYEFTLGKSFLRMAFVYPVDTYNALIDYRKYLFLFLKQMDGAFANIENVRAYILGKFSYEDRSHIFISKETLVKWSSNGV